MAKASKASDKRNNKWLKQQDKIKRDEYAKVWENMPEEKKKPGIWKRVQKWFSDVFAEE